MAASENICYNMIGFHSEFNEAISMGTGLYDGSVGTLGTGAG